MDPMTAMALSAGLNLTSGFISSQFRPQIPNYRARASAAGLNQLRQIDQHEDRAVSRLEGEMRAAGATGFQGVSAREGVARQAADQRATTRANILDTIVRAEMAEEEARAGLNNAQVDARRQGIAGAAAGATQLLLGSVEDTKTTAADTTTPSNFVAPHLTQFQMPQLASPSSLTGTTTDDILRELNPGFRF